jgi:hypothetical protein
MDSYVRKIVGLRNIRISGGEVLGEELVERGGIITDVARWPIDKLVSSTRGHEDWT